MITKNSVLYIPNRLAFLVIGIVILSTCDIFFTLYHIDHGAVEQNPLMDYLLGKGIEYFVVVKSLLVGIGTIGIIIVQPHNRRYGQIGLVICFYVYAMIIVYHIVLLIYIK